MSGKWAPWNLQPPKAGLCVSLLSSEKMISRYVSHKTPELCCITKFPLALPSIVLPESARATQLGKHIKTNPRKATIDPSQLRKILLTSCVTPYKHK